MNIETILVDVDLMKMHQLQYTPCSAFYQIVILFKRAVISCRLGTLTPHRAQNLTNFPQCIKNVLGKTLLHQPRFLICFSSSSQLDNRSRSYTLGQQRSEARFNTYHSPVAFDKIFECDRCTDTNVGLNPVSVQQSQEEKSIVLVSLN